LTIYQVGGHVSKLIVEALLKTRKHTVTITRFDSTTELPTGVIIKKVKYDDQANLVSAIEGQDAIIHTMSGFALPEMQTTLIEAEPPVCRGSCQTNTGPTLSTSR